MIASTLLMVVALLLSASACSSTEHSGTTTSNDGAWSDTALNAASKPVTAFGVTTVTSVRDDGRLRTVVDDLSSGERLWTRPATMSGRPVGMGVQPPAVVGSPDHPVVVNLEPGKPASLVARDARTGKELWARAMHGTYGPQRCGSYVCVTEFTAKKKARFVALDSATGDVRWHLPGAAEVEWADANRAVVFRLTSHPTLQARDLADGGKRWSYSVAKALGKKVSLAGGWSFGAVGGDLVGYIAPYRAHKKGPLSSFGFFSVRLADGHRQWVHRRLLRVYPSASPSVAVITRSVSASGDYGGFSRLDPRTGRTLGKVPSGRAPDSTWWPAFPADLSSIGFLTRGKPGHSYDLTTGEQADGSTLAWSFCTTHPSTLKIKGAEGFYPIAALCPYDVDTGKRVKTTTPPPAWYTGSVDGWRVWRDEHGVLHGVHDGAGDEPGMYT